MKRFVNWLIKLVSPRERLSRKGFIVVFLCAIISIKVFALIAYILWLHYNHYSEWLFNVSLLFYKLFGWIGLIFGIMPLAIYALYACVIDSFDRGYEFGGYSFFVESLVVVAAYILYIIQCIRRCHDLGRKWWFCLIPFYNPFVLLFGKTKGKENNASNTHKSNLNTSIGIILLALCFIGCNNASKNTLENHGYGSAQADTLAQNESFRYTNIDTVIGHFRGKELDTLVFEHEDSTSWRLYGTNEKVTSLTIDNALMLYIVPEGDLDGNGTEEIGIRREQEMGTWRDYNVFTYRNGEWMYLFPSVTLFWSHFYEDLNCGQNVVKPTKKKGYVQVHYSLFNDDAFLLDTIVKVSPISVNSCDTIPFMKIKRQ